MEAGKLRHRVTIQKPRIVVDSGGDRVTAWADVLTVYAAIESMSVQERFLAAQEHASASKLVRIRYHPALAAMDGSWRVLYGSRVLILSGRPDNVDERNREFHLFCEEGLKDG